MEEEFYGINKKYAHERAIQLIPEDFFWDCVDELAPFGSDEGDQALSEFREWKKLNPNTPTYECLKWTLESIGELNIGDYNDRILDRELIKSQIDSTDFDDHYYVFTVDVSVIATGFGQLVDEGIIDPRNKALIQLAIDRQKIWSKLLEDWNYKDEYIERLNVLERALDQA